MTDRLSKVDYAGFVRTVEDFPKPGIRFYDIAPLLGEGAVFGSLIKDMSEPLRGRVDKIVGFDARGFLFGGAMANRLGVGFAMLRKPGKLPGEIKAVSYELEYGNNSLEIQSDSLSVGERVALVDDIIATGGTALAGIELVRSCGAEDRGVLYGDRFITAWRFGKDRASRCCGTVYYNYGGNLMENYCDNTSVGVIIHNEQDDVLLLNRGRFPFGMAAPAGHIDGHGSPEQAAVAEVFEEVGLIVPLSGLVRVIVDRPINNKCRRAGGDHHIWNVYMTKTFSGELRPDKDETKGAAWVSLRALQQLTAANGVDRSVPGAQVLEQVWEEFFIETGLLDRR